jgi:hypothetical protein
MKSMTRRLTWLVVPALAAVCVSAAAADDRPTAAKPATDATADKTAPGVPRPAAGARPAGPAAESRSTSIIGNAWHFDNSPIKGANLRLRNIVTGKIAAVTKANDAGEFTFGDVEAGSYLVELVNDAGHLLTIGHTFTIAPGETVATFVRLTPKVPWTTAFFDSTASSVTATAAAAGVNAFGALAYCQSPPCHD